MDLSEIKAIDAAHFMPVFGERLPAAFTHGEGAKLYDTTGAEYTDFLAGIAVNALGYSDEGFKNALKAQVDSIIHSCNYFYNEQQAQLTAALCEKTGYDRVFFGNSGAEAIECAIKLAKKRAFAKGSASAKFVSLKGSFHGRTLASLTATGQDKFHVPFEPGTYSYAYVEANDCAALTQAVTEDVCGVILEVIQGEGGVNALDMRFVKLARELCDRTGALLIIDEIQTGMGRTGRFLAQELYDVKADIITLAKALGGGVPIGACLCTKQACSFTAGDHGSTFGGGHLACAAGAYVVGAIDDEMLARIETIGAYFKDGLRALKKAHPSSIIDVKGAGLMLGAELSPQHSVAAIKTELFSKKYIIGTAGTNTLRFLPPYIILETEIDSLLSALDELLK